MVSSGTVQSDLSSLTSATKDVSSTISGLSGAWQGASFSSISANIDSVLSECLSVITSQMNSFATACGLVPEYEETKKALATARSNYNSADKDHKSQYSSQISTLQAKLDELKAQIEAALAACSASIPGSSSSSTASVSGAEGDTSGTTTSTGTDALGVGSTNTSSLGTPTYGSFTREVYTCKDGTKITYMLYRPNYNGSTETQGLPTHMYLTGANMKGSGESIMTYGGVGKGLKEQTLNPSGNVIIPHIVSGVQLEKAQYRSDLVELATEVTKQLGGDTNRISLGGHSYGAITAYRLVQEHPNTFSAIVPVSGSAKITNANAFSNVKIWAFHGARDNPGNNTNYTQAVQVINQLQSAGVQATLHAYTEYPNCYHTHTANTTFSNEFESPDGETENPLEWAFEQSKA